MGFLSTPPLSPPPLQQQQQKTYMHYQVITVHIIELPPPSLDDFQSTVSH